jgi:hypothetical protein
MLPYNGSCSSSNEDKAMDEEPLLELFKPTSEVENNVNYLEKDDTGKLWLFLNDIKL